MATMPKQRVIGLGPSADSRLHVPVPRAMASFAEFNINSWLLERKFPQRYGKVDRHVIRTQHEGGPLPSEYIQAINRALGVSGEFKPLIRRGDAALLPGRNGDGTIEDGVTDLEILP